jgi:hypothetical protein
MYTWQRLSESWWAVGSQYWNSNDSSVGSLQTTAVGSATPKDGKTDENMVSAGIIPFLERHTTNEFLLKGRAYTLQRLMKTLLSKDGFEAFESSVSIAHLENRIAGALQLGSKEEFRLYLLMYAKRIGAEGHRGKVEELLNSLLGGVLQDKVGEGDDKGQGWNSKGSDICGWDRNELLKGVVMILGMFVTGAKQVATGGTNNITQANSANCSDSRCSMHVCWISHSKMIWQPMMPWLLKRHDEEVSTTGYSEGHGSYLALEAMVCPLLVTFALNYYGYARRGFSDSSANITVL